MLPLPTRHHMPEGCARTTHERRHVHLHDARPVVVAGFENAAAMRNAGIVDEDIQAAERRQRRGDQAIRKSRLDDVARQKSPTQFARERRACRAVAARQHQLRARGRQLPCDGAADARRCAGNQRGSPLQHGCFRSSKLVALPPLCSRRSNLCKAPHEVRRGAALARVPVGSAKSVPEGGSLRSVYFYIIIKTI